ncbi:MAG: hypothetical protein PVI90_03100 [Desulfobacteraceae bacterium]|jgi:hypothetical protein
MAARTLSEDDKIKLFQNIFTRAKKELVPKLCVTLKNKGYIHSIINTILNLVSPKDRQNGYLLWYSTTFGYTIALAAAYGNNIQNIGAWETLCHEIVHALQAKKYTRVLMAFLYMWPLSQGTLLLLTCWLPIFWASGWVLAIWIPCWILIAGLHFVPQLPDPWRYRWEVQAYSVSMYLYLMVNNRIPSEYVESIIDNLHSMSYYITEPNKGKICSELYNIAHAIATGISLIKYNPIVKIAREEYIKILNE